MNITFDEYGRPFIILKEQRQKDRAHGIDAIKVNLYSNFSMSVDEV